jgi:hypothetical protein
LRIETRDGRAAAVRAASRSPIWWLRIVLGGLAAEAGLFIIAVVFYVLPIGSAELLYVVPVASGGQQQQTAHRFKGGL